MQNKPNFLKSQMNVSNIITRNYNNFIPLAGQKNKPNTNPIKPNLRKDKMNINSFTTKDYRKIDDFAVRINKPNSNPISSKPKMNVNLYIIEDYENKPLSGPKKTNPKQTQFQRQKMTVTDFNLLINFHQIIFMETLKRPPLFIRVTYVRKNYLSWY